MTRRTAILLGLISAAFAVAVVSAVNSFYGNCVRDECDLFVRRSDSFADLRGTLSENIRHNLAFDIYARRINLENRLKPGRYRLEKGMDVMDVARMLKLGNQTPVRIVIAEAHTPEELAARLSRQIEADSASLVHAMRNDSLARSAGFDSVTLFSVFLPDTYEVYWTITPEQLVRRMKREYDAFWSGSRDEKLDGIGLSRLEAQTLASIVYEETKAVDEMPRIAGVYVNRLRRGMPLQACPTVKYALGDFSLQRLLYRHLNVDSPYNTYVRRGLPPSPICIPSKAAIDAVLDYERGGYLYFCARPEFDGRHNFARTLREHNENARKYSEALERRGIK